LWPDYCFVSPCLDDYTLIIGYGKDDGYDEIVIKSRIFEEIQFFASHRVTEYHAWVKFMNSELIRFYAYAGDQGEVVWDKGKMTPEEVQLGFGNFPRLGPVDFSEGENVPNEENVIQIAAAWGIDPTFESSKYGKTTGYLCTNLTY